MSLLFKVFHDYDLVHGALNCCQKLFHCFSNTFNNDRHILFIKVILEPLLAT